MPYGVVPSTTTTASAINPSPTKPSTLPSQWGQCAGSERTPSATSAPSSELPRPGGERVEGPGRLDAGHHYREHVRRDHEAHHRRPHVTHGEHASEPNQDQGPKQVELLLDRQRPEVQQRRGLRVSGEIVGGDDGEAVVRDVQRSRTAIAGDFRESHRRQHQCRRHQGDDDHDQRGRQKSPGSPSVERRKVDATLGLHLPQEQPGDQEAGDDEEDIHADEAAAESRQTRMKSQYGQDRDRPQALDVRPKMRWRFRRDGGIPR